MMSEAPQPVGLRLERILPAGERWSDASSEEGPDWGDEASLSVAQARTLFYERILADEEERECNSQGGGEAATGRMITEEAASVLEAACAVACDTCS